VNAERFKLFNEAYRVALTQAVEKYPDDYPWARNGLTIETVADRMMRAVEQNTHNHSGRAFRIACKALGIKHTRTAIRDNLEGK
jgi:hypothetical protein